MALPCIDDSCNIKAEIDPETRHLVLTALTAANGGLVQCTVDGGLAINVLGDDTAEAAPDRTAFMDIGLTPGASGSSELWTALKSASRHPFGGGVDDAGPNPVAARIKHDGTESLTANAATNPISDNSATNPFNAPVVALVMGTFRLGWSINELADASYGIKNERPSGSGDITYIPYHAKIRAQIHAAIGAEPTDWPTAIGGGSAGPQATAFFDVSGMARNDKAPQHLRDWRDFMFAIAVPAGEQLHLAASAVHHGDTDIRTFVDTETFPAVGGATYAFEDRGIRASGEVIFLPMSGTVVN